LQTDFFSLAKIYKAYGMQYIFVFVLIVLWNRHDVIVFYTNVMSYEH